MKILRTSLKLGLVAFAAMQGSLAIAADSGWYVGGNVGQSRAKIDDERIIGNLLGAGYATTSIDDNNREFGYKIYGGYQFNKYFALESGYFDLGEFGFVANTSPPGTLSGDLRLRGLNLDTVGMLPITDRFSAFGRVGVNYAEAKSSFSGSGSVSAPDSRSRRAANYKFGLGIQYNFTESLGVRTEVERYRIDDAIGNKGDVDLISVGLVYRFFGGAPAPAQHTAAIEPAAASAPAPQKAVAQTPQPLRKVSFSADALFDFDMAAVKPEGKKALDALVADLKGVDFDAIVVTGHADRIGSHAYNMKLSTLRAEAVKAYLVESARIPADKIAAKGIDGADPVTKPGECIGTQRTKALIACLQPDRRVEIEVTGKR